MNNNVKQLGQVFTPRNIVVDILNLMNYEGEKILNKHIIDNSCGDGAFLKVIVERYIDAYKKKHGSLVGIEKDLEVYIHGIEIDYKTYESCVSNLKEIASRFNINDVKWNIVYGDAIEDCSFDYKMDYVVGNPPYVRVHNLGNNFNKIRDYKFCKKGMTDLYILFYEIGFKMLNPNGTLCYITPNSFYSSNAGRVFRQFIFDEKCLVKVIDLGHYQPFKVSTYTTICMFVNNANNEKFKYYKYDLNGKYYFPFTKEFFNCKFS